MGKSSIGIAPKHCGISIIPRLVHQRSEEILVLSGTRCLVGVLSVFSSFCISSYFDVAKTRVNSFTYIIGARVKRVPNVVIGFAHV